MDSQQSFGSKAIINLIADQLSICSKENNCSSLVTIIRDVQSKYDFDHKSMVDIAFRLKLQRYLLAPVPDVDYEHFASLVDLSIDASRRNFCSPAIPMILLNDLFACKTVYQCEILFNLLEERSNILKEELFFQEVKNYLLRCCTDILNRLPSIYVNFKSRILILISDFLPPFERSSLNLLGSCNRKLSAPFFTSNFNNIDNTMLEQNINTERTMTYKNMLTLQDNKVTDNFVIEASKTSTKSYINDKQVKHLIEGSNLNKRAKFSDNVILHNTNQGNVQIDDSAKEVGHNCKKNDIQDLKSQLQDETLKNRFNVSANIVKQNNFEIEDNVQGLRKENRGHQRIEPFNWKSHVKFQTEFLPIYESTNQKDSSSRQDYTEGNDNQVNTSRSIQEVSSKSISNDNSNSHNELDQISFEDLDADKDLHDKFIMLQECFNSCKKCLDEPLWSHFKALCDDIVIQLFKSKIDYNSTIHNWFFENDHIDLSAFTSRYFLKLKFLDPYYNMYMLIHFLIFFQFVLSFKDDLDTNDTKWCLDLSAKIFEMVEKIKGSEIRNCIQHLLTREEFWCKRKKEGMNLPEKSEILQIPKDKSKMRISDIIKHKESIQNVDILEHCKNRATTPGLDEYLLSILSCNKIKKEKMSDSKFKWKLLRLLSRKCPKFFTLPKDIVKPIDDYIIRTLDLIEEANTKGLKLNY